MSRIALEPNSSGSGVFTIASPNSNTSRTLNLPDAAGTVYAQGNILGTVSQSGGVPTGAIIERGSNANGEFVKYADGTLICTFVTPSVTLQNTATNFSFPATFVGSPTAAQCASALGSAANRSTARDTVLLPTSGGDWQLRIEPATSYTVQAQEYALTAIGRWF
jgi:hypothetical protein